MTSQDFRRSIEEHGKLDACRKLNPSCESEEHADVMILAYVQSLLQSRKYAAAGSLLWGESLFNPKPECVQRVWRAVDKKTRILIQGAGAQGKSYTGILWVYLDWLADPEFTTVKLISTTGGHAKCFGEGTEIRMADGTKKKVEEIRSGDRVMGPDSTPRKVTSIHRGEDDLFYIRPHRTEGFVCNGNHVLHLEQTLDKKWKILGEVRHLSVRDYIEKSATFKGEFKMARQGFDLLVAPTKFDPYIVGLWIGDGSSSGAALTTMDDPIRDRWCGYFERLGYIIKKYTKPNNKASTYHARIFERGSELGRQISGRGKKSNPFTSYVRSECQDISGKRIPTEILTNCRKVRMSCLAGIVDTDGGENQGGYIIFTKFRGLRDDILNLCESLGFHTVAKAVTGIGWRIYIRGMCHEVPVLLEHKKCVPTQTKQRPVGFSVRPIQRGAFYGFSVDGDHLFLLGSGLVAHNSNTFSTMVSLHRQALCPLPGIVRAESIALTESDKRACISIVRIREGADNSGVLQGFHPLPRPKPHPIFGLQSRVRAVLDEAEEIPTGVWSGIDNMLTSMSEDSDEVKIMGFYNPKDITSKTAALAEPRNGWGEFDVETGVRGKDEWTSRSGWYVVRLDAKKTENVKQRKKVYGGFQTYEGYRVLEQKDGGNSLNYYVFGRGAYPPDSAAQTVVPMRVMSLMRGEFSFTGKTVKLGSCDIAIDGRDEAVFSAGRWGRATAIKRMTTGEHGEAIWNTVKFPEDRWALQLDQQFAIPKGSAQIVGNGIKATCIKLGIAPENMMLDATGNGSPVLGYLRIPEVWSPSVQGIDFGKPATATKIFEQDQKTCEQQFDGIHTEVWFALSRWGEFGYFAISPSVRSENLERELTGRKYILSAGETMKVEKKEIYNARLGRSPDHADSATILVHKARTMGEALASMTGVQTREEYLPDAGNGLVDQVTWFNPQD